MPGNVDSSEGGLPPPSDPVEVVEGSPVEGFGPSNRSEHDLPFLPDAIKEGAARNIAYSLIGILAGSLLLHYVTVVILLSLRRIEEVKILEHLFNSWLPVISGLASSAATYYFTKNKE